MRLEFPFVLLWRRWRVVVIRRRRGSCTCNLNSNLVKE